MEKPPLCIYGLGYVGLPLAYAFAKNGYPVIGYDINQKRIDTLKAGNDWTNELTADQLKSVAIEFSTDPSVLEQAKIIIIALPTPVDEHNKPDLTILEAGTKTVGQHLKKGMIVVYESTVYPGVTEEICGPILEKESGLTCGVDFTLGYSPERINPGDKQHTVETIIKIVAGQDEKTTDILCDLYGSIVKAGIHRAPSIKVAEMAKAIENAQRDINIAYVNEIAMLCTHLDIRTKDVLEAAGTKWNFLKFQPGLVGGHCIGVDPYYLVEKAKELGMNTQLITAGRSINDGMATFIADQIIKTPPSLPLPGGEGRGEGSEKKILVLGVTFKENVPDLRNSKVFDIIDLLQKRGATVEVHDPFHEKILDLPGGSLQSGPYDAILYLVPHKEYTVLPVRAFIDALKPGGMLFDLRSLIDSKTVTHAGRQYGSL